MDAWMVSVALPLAIGNVTGHSGICGVVVLGFLSRDRRGPTTQKTCFDDGDGVDRGARCPMPTRSFVSISALNGRSFFSVILFFFDGFVPFFSAKDKNISLPRPPSLPPSLFFHFLITNAAPLNKFSGGIDVAYDCCFCCRSKGEGTSIR